MSFDHCAGGLHSGYCLGNFSLSQKVLNVTWYTTNFVDWHFMELASLLTLAINRKLVITQKSNFEVMIKNGELQTLLGFFKARVTLRDMIWRRSSSSSSRWCGGASALSYHTDKMANEVRHRKLMMLCLIIEIFGICISDFPQCLKITLHVAFEFLNCGIFHQFLSD